MRADGAGLDEAEQTKAERKQNLLIGDVHTPRLDGFSVEEQTSRQVTADQIIEPMSDAPVG